MNGPTYQQDSAAPRLASIKDLLHRAGIDCPDEPAIIRLTGGANNGVFRVDLPDESYLLKQYFSHPEDPRDRFATETTFIDFLWRNGIRNIPKLLAALAEERLALYRFIPGRSLRAAEVDESHVDHAAEFCREVFHLQELDEARQLPTASEACFSIPDHLQCVDRRLARLHSIPPDSAIHNCTIRFVNEELEPCWNAIWRHARQVDPCGGDPAAPVLSPSDFGFHNAILTGSGRLCFFDFEYAGWDDPAKMICDFFCQVELPAPRTSMPRFIQALQCPGAGAEMLAQRVDCLFPVYVLKWCAIVLNDFVPIASARRRFSAAEPPSADRLRLQLEKARLLLRSVERS